MRIIAVIAMLIGSVSAATAQYYNYGTGSNLNSNNVQGYTNSHGNYVESYQRTNPNSTQYDNYQSRGNYNPSNNSFGTRSPRY